MINTQFSQEKNRDISPSSHLAMSRSVSLGPGFQRVDPGRRGFHESNQENLDTMGFGVWLASKINGI